MQIRSNRNFAEDSANGQTLRKNNENAKNSFYSTISEVSQESTKDKFIKNTLFRDESIQFLETQQLSKNLRVPSTLNVKILIKFDIFPNHKVFNREKEIAAEIEQLKKKPKKSLNEN